MKTRCSIAVALAAAAIPVTAVVTGYIRNIVLPPDIPPELAEDVALLKQARWRPVRLCSRRCRHRRAGQPHVHVIAPWGDLFAFGPGELQIRHVPAQDWPPMPSMS